MKKTVYSLLLDDEIVEKVDLLAYRRGISRSQMINRILAERVSHETPEQRMETVFQALEQLSAASGALRFCNLPTASMAYYSGALSYPYRPAVRYAIELYAENSDFLGELKVTFRTKNERLLDELDDFFLLWRECERTHLKRYVRWELERGRYRRILFRPPQEAESGELGRLITDYVDRLNELMNAYIRAAQRGEDAAAVLAKNYRRTLKDTTL